MIALIQALEAYFSGNSSLVAAFPPYNNVGGGAACACNFWQDLLPENAPLPGCVYSVVSSVSNAVYPLIGNYAPSTNVIRFTVYATGKNAALTAAETVQSQMNLFNPTLSSGTISNVNGMNEPMPFWEAKNKSGEDVWGATLAYEIAVDPLP